MGTVQGQVVCTESGLGISGLLVEALDIPGTEVSEGIVFNPKTRRLASGLTGAGGKFRLSFVEPAGDPVPISLLVAVSGPEASGRGASHLFISPRARVQAAAEESYFIQIPEEALKPLNLKPPGVVDEAVRPAEIAARRIVRSAEDDVQIADAETAGLKLKIDRASEVAVDFNTKFRGRIKQRLSQVSDARAGSDTFVADDKVEKASATLIAADLLAVINQGGSRADVKVRFALTEAQHRKIKDALANRRVSRGKMRQILGAQAFADAGSSGKRRRASA